MGGIAGAIDLVGGRNLAPNVLADMADALAHRGPDGAGFFHADGIHLAQRLLRFGELPVEPRVAQAGGVHAVSDGALTNYAELEQELVGRGRAPRTPADAELLALLWQEHGEGMLPRLRGQFAFALWDSRARRFILVRDRFGICPLYWARQGDWLLFASDIKALIASGMTAVRPDLRGIHHLFTFYGQPGPATCFEGISALLPGRCLQITPQTDGRRSVAEHVYWEIDFPARGQEESGDAGALTDRLEQALLEAVDRRLRGGRSSRAGQPPAVCYLSGGVDSGLVTALTAKCLGAPPPTFTARINDALLDESSSVGMTARKLGCEPTVVSVGTSEVLAAYPRMVAAVEAPVVDTACAALLLVAEEVKRHGGRVALTGEGADEWLASYPWYKLHRLFGMLDVIPGIKLSQAARRWFLRLTGAPLFSRALVKRTLDAVGGPNPWIDMYGLYSLNKLRFFGPRMREVMLEHNPYEDLQLNLERMARWHPLNRGVYVGSRTQLPGLLLHGKGDRICMSAGVQSRYAFLDEDVVDFLATLAPRWKLRGFTDKYLLRLVADRHLPREIAWRRKDLFRAPFDGFHFDQPPAYVEQLFSPESLRQSGYFDAPAVAHWRGACRTLRPGSMQRVSIEMGLAAVFSTQLWHRLFVDASLCELPKPPLAA